MNKNKLAAGALALAVTATACGCGQMYELTDNEEAAIVNYSAHAVSKFNKNQSEGIENVTVLEQQLEEQKQQKKEEKQQEPVEDTKPDTAGTAPESASEGTDLQQQAEYVSLNQALKLGGIDAVYQSCELAGAYQQTDSYAVTAGEGSELLILHVDLRNSGNKAAECDILSKMPSFRLTINDKLSVSADTTILLNDLGTYQGRIEAGGSVNTVLIFQVQKGKVKNPDSMVLETVVDGESSLVKL